MRVCWSVIPFLLSFTVAYPLFAMDRPLKELTVLVYAAGDEESIHESTNDSLKRFERLHSLRPDSQVTVVAQHDDSGQDLNYRYVFQYVANPTDQVGPDTPPVPEQQIREWQKDVSVFPTLRSDEPFHYQERDSGNPVTLKEFIRWGVTAYPARHYILVLSGHSWGQEGILQDFFVDGKELRSSTLIKNYELRRVLEETYAELNHLPGHDPLIPEGKFDLLVFDGCVFGEFDVLYEYTDVLKYFWGSTMETPYHSIPWDKILDPYFNWVTSHLNRPRIQWDRDLEDRLLKPMVTGYVGAHVRGGSLVGAEHQIDSVEAMALRVEKLRRVGEALRAFLDPQTGIPSEAREDWDQRRIADLERVADTDSNADMWQMASVFADYFGQQRWKTGDTRWDRAQELALRLRDSFDEAATDPTMQPIHLQSPNAKGAWVHIQIDEMVSPRDMATCLALKEFVMQNQGLAGIPIPTFHDSDGSLLTATKVDCDHLQDDYQNADHDKDPPRLDFSSAPVNGFFDEKVVWGKNVPAYVNEEKAGGGTVRRYLSVWIPSSGSSSARIDQDIRVRLSGTEEVTVEYLVVGDPLDAVTGDDAVARWEARGQTLHFPSMVASTQASDFQSSVNPGLFIAEAHSNGAYFKRGMGIFLNHQLHTDNDYEGGRIPIEWIHPTWTIEAYMAELQRAGEVNTQKIQGTKFYRSHRISETLWPDFLFGPDDFYLETAGESARRRKAHVVRFEYDGNTGRNDPSRDSPVLNFSLTDNLFDN